MRPHYNPNPSLMSGLPDAESRWRDGTLVNIYYVKPDDIKQMIRTSNSLDARIYAATYITNIKIDNLDPSKYRLYYETDLSVSPYLYYKLFKDYIYLSYDELITLVLEELKQINGPDVCKAIERNLLRAMTLFNELLLEHIDDLDLSHFVPDLDLKIENQTVKGRGIVSLTSTNLRLLLNDITTNFDFMVNYYVQEADSAWKSLIKDLVNGKCNKNINKILSQFSGIKGSLHTWEIFRELEYIAVFEAEVARYYKHNMGIDWFISYKDDEDEIGTNRRGNYYYKIEDYESYYGEQPAQVIPAIVMPKSFAGETNVYVINLIDLAQIAKITAANDDYDDSEEYE